MGQPVYDPFNKSFTHVNPCVRVLTCVTLLLNVYIYIYSLIDNFICDLRTRYEHDT
jgi:hypothetical protein